jgi:hypothetical protein
MSGTADPLSKLLPTAQEMLEKMAEVEERKLDEEKRAKAKAEAEKKELIDRLNKPSGLSDEEVLKRAAAIIERAVRNGLTSVQVYRFPNQLCTDRGRAINQREPGWEKTLTGRPKEVYQFWQKHLHSRGYKLTAEIVDFPGGIPGDVGLTLSWLHQTSKHG